MTPFYWYENSADPLSQDSVDFKVEQAIRSLAFAMLAGYVHLEDSSYANVCQHDYFYLQGAKRKYVSGF